MQPLPIASNALPVAPAPVRSSAASLDLEEAQHEHMSGSPGTPDASGDSGLASLSSFDDVATSPQTESFLEPGPAEPHGASTNPSPFAGSDVPALSLLPAGRGDDDTATGDDSEDESSSMEGEELPPLRSALSGGLSAAARTGGGGGMRRTVSWGDMNPSGALTKVVEYDPQSAPIAPRSDDPAWEPPTRDVGCSCCVM